MAVKGMSVFTHQGEDYTINDPNNAPEFDVTLANEKGEYVYYQGDLYRFNAAHSANTTWANRSKTKVKLGAELLAEITNRETMKAELKTEMEKLIDINGILAGCSALRKVSFSITDPDTSDEIGTALNTAYTLTGTKFLTSCQYDIIPGEAQRLWFYSIMEISKHMSGVILNGIYETGSGTKLSTNVVTGHELDGKYITIGYFDVPASSTRDRVRALLGYSYESSGAVIKVDKFDIITDAYQPSKVIYLDVGVDMQFPSFTAAFNYAKGAPWNRYAVKYFGNGVAHDVSLETGNTDPLGLHVPENIVEIIGVKDRDMNILSDSYYNGQAATFCIDYGTVIRNIYFIGTAKYCIHIDDPRNQRHDTVIENCRFYHATGGSGAIGMGFQAMTNITIKNCYFERDTDAGIRIHTHPYPTQTAGKLNIIGNYFKAGAMVHAIHLYTFSTYDYGYPIANIIGNDLNGLDILLSEEDWQNLGVGNRWRVWGHHNSETVVNITHHDPGDYSDCVQIFLPDATVNDQVLS